MSLFLALALQGAGLKPEIEESLVKELQAVASSKSVAYITSYLKDAPKNRDYLLTFLDAKAKVTCKVTASWDLQQVSFSPDGTMVAALVDTYVGGDPMDVTDVLVVTKDGLLAKTHLKAGCRFVWAGNNIILEGYADKFPFTRFGPDAELGVWSTKKIREGGWHFKCSDGNAFWSRQAKDATKEESLTLVDDMGVVKKSIDIGKRDRIPKLKAPGTPFLLLTSSHYVGDGVGGYDSLFVMDTDTTQELQIAPELDSLASYVWLSGPRIFGFTLSHALRGQISFFSPETGKSFTVGPGDMFSPSCAALDADTVLVVGNNKVYKMVPRKFNFEKMAIPDMPEPDKVYSCR